MSLFGEYLKELRTNLGMSQRELGEKVGLDFTYISKIETGTLPPPSEEKLLAMEVILKVDKYDLVLYADKIPSDFKKVILSDQDVQDYLREIVEVWENIGHVADGKRYFDKLKEREGK